MSETLISFILFLHIYNEGWASRTESWVNDSLKTSSKMILFMFFGNNDNKLVCLQIAFMQQGLKIQ